MAACRRTKRRMSTICGRSTIRRKEHRRNTIRMSIWRRITIQSLRRRTIWISVWIRSIQIIKRIGGASMEESFSGRRSVDHRRFSSSIRSTHMNMEEDT